MIFLCYSIDNLRSFLELEDWLDAIEVDRVARSLPIALIATKVDLEGEHQRAVS